MRRVAVRAALCLVPLLVLGGCAGKSNHASDLDRSAIALTVGDAIKAFSAAVAAKDSAAIDSLYTDDAVLLPAAMPQVEGRAAIHRWWAGGLAAPGLRLVLVPRQTTVAQAGDLAMVVGAYEYEAAGPGGAVQREVGKFVNVLKPERDRWRIVMYVWNSDAPPAR
jgi:ketosteroid isomerase-like protein